MLVLCLKILHLVLSSDSDIHQVIEVFKLGSGELVLQFFRKPIIQAFLLLGISSHFFRCILGEGVEGIDIGHHIPISLSKIQKFLLLNVHDTLRNMEGAKSCVELLSCEAVVGRVRCLKVPPPSPRGIMKLMSSEKNLLMWLTLNKIKLFFNHIEPEIRIKRILGAMKDGRIGTEEFPEPVHLRLSSWAMIAGIAHLIDYGRHKFSLRLLRQPAALVNDI